MHLSLRALWCRVRSSYPIVPHFREAATSILRVGEVATNSEKQQEAGLDHSPEKNIRRLRSHQQLSSNSRQLHQTASKTALNGRSLREQLPAQAKTTDSLPSRNRANSDAPMPFERTKFQRKPIQHVSNPSTGHARKSSLEATLREGPSPGTNPSVSLGLLRHSILTSGVQATKEGMSDYRIYLWLALLNVAPLPTDEYLNQVHRGRSPAHEKIANDVFRTTTTDMLFKRRVTDASLTRILNATAWRIHDAQKAIPSARHSV
ncbi:hypothetical protein Q3G72_016931 [Acer saccharum]|nr:hypothetical protein Q3G72_016931 [Acer saccharum]